MGNDTLSKLRSLEWLIHRYRMSLAKSRKEPFSSGRGQGRIIALLKRCDGLPTKDISYLMGIRQQSLNELLKKLEAAGYIERRPSDEDKRVLNVYLTEKGKEETIEEPDFSALLKGFTEEEIETLNGYLDRMTDNLESAVEAEDPKFDTWMDDFEKRHPKDFRQTMDACGHHRRGHGRRHGHPHHRHHHHPRTEIRNFVWFD